MKVSFFTAVLNIECSTIPAAQDQIADGLYISTDKDILARLVPEAVVKSIGTLELGFLRSAPAIIYSIQDLSDDFNWRDYLAGLGAPTIRSSKP